MEYRQLGRTGLKVSRFCLGTMIFGSECNEQRSRAILDQAVDLGINFLDLSDMYPVPPNQFTWGLTEEIVGRWLPTARSQLVLATKFMFPVGNGPNDSGGSRKHVIEACEASLRRLRTDYIDLYYAHQWDPTTPIDETLEALDRLLDTGKILYVGVSNFEAWQLAMAAIGASEADLALPVALQPRYNLLHRRPERDLLPLAQALGIGVMPYNPLAAGVLAGKYAGSTEPPPESRFTWGDYGKIYRDRYWSEHIFGIVNTFLELARDHHLTPTQLALGWLLHRETITAPVVGASRPEHLRESIAALGRPIEPDALTALDQLTAEFA